jgi:hypothetical protein
MVHACDIGCTCLEESLTKPIERFGLQIRIADRASQPWVGRAR